MTPSADDAAVLSAVGRRGVVDYLFERDGARTVLTRASCSSPWHYLPPTYQDETGCAYTWLVNPSGGLVGGDELTVRAALQADTHVLITSPSANRVYRSVGEPARQDIYLAVGPRARLEWLPELTIPFASARFTQTLHVTLGERAAAVVWDALAAGRIARNERWAFAAVESEIRITTSTGAVVMERFHIEPETIGASLDAWNYVASLFIIADGPDALVWERLAAELRNIVKDKHGRILGGVSEPAASGVVVKLVARTAQAVADVLDALTSVVRQRLWELPPPVFRRY